MRQCSLLIALLYPLAPHCLLPHTGCHLRKIKQVASCTRLRHHHCMAFLVSMICNCLSSLVSCLVQNFKYPKLKSFLQRLAGECIELSFGELHNQGVNFPFCRIEVFPYLVPCLLGHVCIGQCSSKPVSKQIFYA